RGRDGQALARGLHAPTPRAGRRLAADQPQRLLRLTGSVAESFVRRLEASARRTPDKPALVWEGGAVTFDELDRRADAFAAILEAKGVQPGDRIALAIGNHWAFAVALLAGWKLGATVAPLDPLLKADERAEILADLRPTLLIDAAIVGGLGRGGAGGAGRVRVPWTRPPPPAGSHRPGSNHPPVAGLVRSSASRRAQP